MKTKTELIKFDQGLDLESGERLDTFDLMVETYGQLNTCLLYTSPSPRDVEESRMPSSA